MDPYDEALASAASGDLNNALRLGTQLLAARTEALGERHPDSLAIAVLVASWRLGIGDVPGALDAARELVPNATEVLGAEHPSTVSARHVLVSCDPELALDPAAALASWVSLYGEDQRVFGAEHHLTLQARHQIGQLRRQLGDLIGARDEMAATALAIRRVLGDHHPESLAIQLTAAICVGEAGDSAAAITEFDRLIPLLTSVLGYDHQHTLLARHTRALWLPPNDVELLDRVSEWVILHDDEVRALGEQHELTVAARLTLEEQRVDWQESLEAQDDVSTALLIEFELEDRGLEFDPERPWGDFGDLDEEGRDSVSEQAADIRDQLEDSMEAVVEAKRSVGQAIRQFGITSKECLTRRYELAHALWRGHEFDTARARTEPLIADCSALLGDDHPLTQATRSLLVAIQERRWS